MKFKIGINGFGRIGRNVLRAYLSQPLFQDCFEIVHINDIASPDQLIHLFCYDSVLGVYRQSVNFENNILCIENHRIFFSQEKDLSNIGWDKQGVDLVIESTGIFLSARQAQAHLVGQVKHVVFSAPAADDIEFTFVKGVNDSLLKKEYRFISNASCTTNCLSPIVKILDEEFGLQSGLMNTVHSYTLDQRLLDAPHSDLRRARAAALSMIPTTTGATRAVEKIFPHLQGKINGFAVRVPVPNGSLIDFTAILKTSVSVSQVNATLEKAAAGLLKGVLEYSDLPLVSRDILGNSHSSIVDSLMTQVVGDNMVRIVSWYDNEWGYSNRLLDLCMVLAKK